MRLSENPHLLRLSAFGGLPSSLVIAAYFYYLKYLKLCQMALVGLTESSIILSEGIYGNSLIVDWEIA